MQVKPSTVFRFVDKGFPYWLPIDEFEINLIVFKSNLTQIVQSAISVERLYQVKKVFW